MGFLIVVVVGACSAAPATQDAQSVLGAGAGAVPAQPAGAGQPAAAGSGGLSAIPAAGSSAGAGGHDASAAGSAGTAASASAAGGAATSFKYRGEGIRDIQCTGTTGTTVAKRNTFDRRVTWNIGTGDESDVVGHVLVVHDGAARIACGKIELQ